MNERKLRIFYEVATKLNMTETAEKMYISQSAISQTIQEIERELSVKLFDRIGKKLYLTQEGEVFLIYVRRMLNLYDEGIRTVKEMNNLTTGKLKIGASTTIGIYVLPDIVGKFIKQYKGIDISIVIENTQIISDMILKNEIDIAFVEGPVYSQEIVVKDFCEDELVFIASVNHLLTKKDVVEINEIEDQKLIMREIGSGTRDVFERELDRNDILYNNKFELGNTEAIKKAVEADLGISCISRRCIKNELESRRLSVIKIKDVNIKRKFTLIYHKDKYFSKLIETFIEFAKAEVNI